MSRHRLNRHQQPDHVHSGHGTPAHGNLSGQQKQQGYTSHAAG
jgi:hypothetical protein